MEQVTPSKRSPPERMSVCKLPGKSGLGHGFQYCLGECCSLALVIVAFRTAVT